MTEAERESLARASALEHASKFAGRLHETEDSILAKAEKFFAFLHVPEPEEQAPQTNEELAERIAAILKQEKQADGSEAGYPHPGHYTSQASSIHGADPATPEPPSEPDRTDHPGEPDGHAV